jgi:hypothetical protein
MLEGCCSGLSFACFFVFMRRKETEWSSRARGVRVGGVNGAMFTFFRIIRDCIINK